VLGLMRFREPLSIALNSLGTVLAIRQQQVTGIS